MKTILLSIAALCLLVISAPAAGDSNVETLTIEKINQRLYDIPADKIIKLRFDSRGDITSIPGGKLAVNLWDKQNNHIYVEFPKEGLAFFKQLPTTGSGKNLTIFATVSPAALQNRMGASYDGPALTAVGRTQVQGFGADDPTTYKW